MSVVKAKVKCYLIGNDSLAYECARRLIAHPDYQLLGIISSDPLFKTLSEEESIPSFNELSSWITSERNVKFDYLFSVINHQVLPANVLKRPSKAAINFHDSPLPKYAGLHATSWAILNQETKHGVTWHTMSELIDGGMILKQKSINIEAHDTALILNMKCYEAALELFDTLLQEIISNNCTPLPQDLSQRKFYGSTTKPKDDGILSFTEDSETLYRSWRAMYFGQHANDFCSAKLLIDTNCFIPHELRIVPTESPSIPGTILSLTSDHLKIATTTNAILITALKTLDGNNCTFYQFKQITGLEEGNLLPSPNKEALKRIRQSLEKAIPHERFWVNEWKSAHRLIFPYISNIPSKTQVSSSLKFKLTPPSSINNIELEWDISILALITIYLFRLANTKNVTLGINRFNKETTQVLVSNTLPLNVAIAPDFNFEDVYFAVHNQIKIIEQHYSYIEDLGYRQPDLHDILNKDAGIYPCTINIDNTDDKNFFDSNDKSLFNISLVKESQECTVYIKSSLQNDYPPKQLVKRIQAELNNLNASINQNTQLPITRLSLLVPQEEAMLLAQSSQYTNNILELNIIDHFRQQVKQTPKQVAVISDKKEMTYTELDNYSNSLAAYLLKKIKSPQQKTILFMNQSDSAIISMLAILKINCVYVPLNPDNPKHRIQFILNDVKAALVLTTSAYKTAIEDITNELGIPLVDIDAPQVLTKYSLPRSYNPKIYPDDLAYILYTSGSTGNPKGVEITHKGVVRLVKAQNYIQFQLTDTVAQFTTLSFDVSTFEIYGALLNGSNLFIIDKKLGLDPVNLATTIAKNCTILFMTPAVFSEVFKAQPQAFDHLRVLILGGETVPSEDVSVLLKRKNQLKLKLNIINGYGPTENTTWSTYYIIEKIKKGLSSIPIGKPIAFTEAYILDDYQNLLPIGVPGELYLGGAGIAKGYINQPNLTESVFVKHPFTTDDTAKLYKTGDIVKMLPDGNILFLRRKDEQVKIRGIRVEPAEIESWLHSHPTVKQSVVAVKHAQSKRNQLVAYIVPENKIFSIDKIQHYLYEHLPEFMVPLKYVILDKLPLSPSGKVDKSKLPDPIPYDTKNYQGPRNDKEQLLAKVWSQVLRTKHIGRNDNFFLLGGDSIVAMQIITKLNQEGWRIRASDIFHHPTISKLSHRMKSAHSGSRTSKTDSVIEGKVGLTPIQSWFFELGFKTTSHFSQFVVVKLNIKPISSIIEKSFDALIQHHDILRASFELSNGNWCQTIKSDQFSLKLAHEKLSGKKSLYTNEAIEYIVRNKYSKFDLSSPPLLKCVLLKDSQNHYLVMIAHHLIIDVVSWRIFLDDFFMAYHTYTNNQTIVLPMKSSSYKLWSELLAKYSESSFITKEIPFWLEQTTLHHMPIDHFRGENTEKSARVLCSELDLSQISLNYKQVSPKDILTSALVLTLSKWLETDTVGFFIEGHGRETFNGTLDLSRTIGWLTSLYPIKLDLDKNLIDEVNYLNLIRDIRKKLSNIPHHGIGFGLLKYLNNDPKIKEQMAKITAPPISFNFLGNFDVGVNHSDMQYINRPIRVANSPACNRSHLIDITVWIKNDQLHIEWQYSSNYHKASTIQKLSNDYLKYINIIVTELIHSVAETFLADDFPLVSLGQDQLNICINKYPNLENITQLSSLQSGLLFHSLQYPTSNMYHSQFAWTDHRGLDLHLFKKAWETVIDRHNIFRTNFLWKHFDNPIQIIDSNINLPWKSYDCSTLSKESQTTKISAIIREDQERPFDFSEHPLMRLSVIKISPQSNIIIWTHHHILLGGWSINNVIHEVYTIYKAFVEEQPYHLPHSASFSDYIAYQLKIFNHKLSKRFWLKYLYKFSGTLISKELGSSHHKSTPEFQQLELTLPPQEADNLKLFAKSNNTSLNTVMLYAWSLIISRYTNSTDVGVGVVVSTQPNDYFNNESIVGPLINTLPFRLNIYNNETIQQTLKTINTHILNITQHSHTALLDIYTWLKRNTQDQLFDSLFVFENHPLDFIDEYISDLKITDITHYPLVLTVFPHDKIRLIITYDKNTIQPDIISNIMSSYIKALNEVQKSSKEYNSNLNSMSDRESQTLNVLWNQTKQPYPEFNIPYLFDAIANNNAKKSCISFNGNKINYSTLQQKVNQWANYLISKNLGKGDAVAIYLDRSIEMVIAILATLKAGGVYVPIDVSYPKERINYIIQDSNIKFIFSQSNLILNLNPEHQQLALNIFNAQLCEYFPISQPSVDLTHNDLAYIIYTSGSTGVPKGIQIRQKSVVNTIYSIFNELNVQSTDKLLSFTSIAFDISALEILGPLLWGMEVEIASSESIMNPSSLIQLVLASLPTLIQATPGFLQMMINAGWKDGQGIKILCGGEALSQGLATAILNTGASLWNVYGPSETTIWSTISSITPHKTVNIGKPIANTQVYVLNNTLQPCPIGVSGELYIGGDGIAKGYLNRPTLNKQQFIPNPFSENTVLYKTGDLVRWSSQGELEFIDRIDNQIKIRGYRVELEEIRAHVLKHPLIQDCLVLKVEHSYEDTHLVAFIILKDANQTIENADIVSVISPYLPSYMIPDDFIITMPNFPLTSNGKVDKKVLLESYYLYHQKKIDRHMVIENPTEKLILNIFNKVLSSNNIQLNDNFFELGGNSISAIQILSSLQDCFSISLSMHNILSMPTPSQLANAIIHKKFQYIDSYEHIPSPIVGLQLKGEKPPLFLIHPVGGTIFWFVKLANLMGKDRPIYAIQDPALVSGSAHFSTFEAMATFYLKEIKNIQSSGPYYIAGASFGANMAFEIAQQLIAEGKSVAFVGLLDGWALYPDIVSTHKFLKKEMKAQYDDIKKKMPDINMKNIKPIIDIAWHRSHLLASYQPEIINCPLTLFKAEQTLNIFSNIESSHNHWLNKTPHLDVINVPGDHETMFFHPNVEFLAHHINHALEEIELEQEIVRPRYQSSTVLSLPHQQPSVTELFKASVEQDLSAFAVVFNGRCMTYETLNNCANQVAHYLINRGIKRGDLVGIYVDHSVDMLIAMLGVLKSSAAYTPIQMTDYLNRYDDILPLCKTIITQKCYLRKFSLSEKNLICIERDWPVIRNESSANPSTSPAHNDIAIILPSPLSEYTPYRLVINHQHISQFIQWSTSKFSSNELGGVLASNPLLDVFSIFECFSPLCSGGVIHLVKSAQNLSDVPYSNNITLMTAQPEILNTLLSQNKMPSSIHTVMQLKDFTDNGLLNTLHRFPNIKRVLNAFIQIDIATATSQIVVVERLPMVENVDIDLTHSSEIIPIANVSAGYFTHDTLSSLLLAPKEVAFTA